jgi:hypothetical protein
MTTGSFASFTTQTTVDWFWLTLLWVAYYAVLEGLFDATIGKRIAGLRVTDLEGRRIGWQAAILRNLGRLLDALPFLYLLGGVLTLNSRLHRRLGDRFAGTLVVPVAAVVGPPLPPDVRRRRAAVVAVVTALLLAFCAGFAYFGRPTLVIEGAKNTGGLNFFGQLDSYSLGTPRWGIGKVTYPITYDLPRTGQRCQGLISLDWYWQSVGWMLGNSEYHCSPPIFP